MELVPASDYWDLIVKSSETPMLGLIFRVPPRFHRPIALVQEKLREVDKRHLFAKPSTLHLTVKGFGTSAMFQEKLEMLLTTISKIISEFSPFEIRLKGLSYFPTSIYIKVEDHMDQLRMINKCILEKFGDQIETSQFDGDSYIPHVTIGTFNSKDAEALISKIKSSEMQEIDFGIAEVFELEAIEARMYLLLGQEDSQDRGLSYIRSFHLGV